MNFIPNELEALRILGLFLPFNKEIDDGSEGSIIINPIWILTKSRGVLIYQIQVIELIKTVYFSQMGDVLLNICLRLVFIWFHILAEGFPKLMDL
jgi:hypothetical protein